jgi:hypothetical protein
MIARIVLGFIALLFLLASLETMHVLAGSSKNPYSGFNISGINYGAQEWDRQHGKIPGGKTYYRRYRRR